MGPGKALKIMMPVGTEIVQDQVDAFLPGIAPPEALPRLEDIPGSLSPVDDPFEHIPVDVIEAKELLRSCRLAIGGPYALRVPLPGPGHPGNRAKLHRSELIEADSVGTWRSFRIEFQNAVFFTSKSGSGDSFQVFVRWSVTPSRLSNRRTHSSV